MMMRDAMLMKGDTARRKREGGINSSELSGVPQYYSMGISVDIDTFFLAQVRCPVDCLP